MLYVHSTHVYTVYVLSVNKTHWKDRVTIIEQCVKDLSLKPTLVTQSEYICTWTCYKDVHDGRSQSTLAFFYIAYKIQRYLKKTICQVSCNLNKYNTNDNHFKTGD